MHVVNITMKPFYNYHMLRKREKKLVMHARDSAERQKQLSHAKGKVSTVRDYGAH